MLLNFLRFAHVSEQKLKNIENILQLYLQSDNWYPIQESLDSVAQASEISEVDEKISDLATNLNRLSSFNYCKEKLVASFGQMESNLYSFGLYIDDIMTTMAQIKLEACSQRPPLSTSDMLEVAKSEVPGVAALLKGGGAPNTAAFLHSMLAKTEVLTKALEEKKLLLGGLEALSMDDTLRATEITAKVAIAETDIRETNRTITLQNMAAHGFSADDVESIITEFSLDYKNPNLGDILLPLLLAKSEQIDSATPTILGGGGSGGDCGGGGRCSDAQNLVASIELKFEPHVQDSLQRMELSTLIQQRDIERRSFAEFVGTLKSQTLKLENQNLATQEEQERVLRQQKQDFNASTEKLARQWDEERKEFSRRHTHELLALREQLAQDQIRERREQNERIQTLISQIDTNPTLKKSLNECVLCKDTILGIFCHGQHERHFLCINCLSEMTGSQSRDFQKFTNQGGKILCAYCSNLKAPSTPEISYYQEAEICNVVREDSLKCYLKAKEDAVRVEEDSKAAGQFELMKAKHSSELLALEEKFSDKPWIRQQKRIERHRLRIISEILETRCPHCNQAFLDWDACYAVKHESTIVTSDGPKTYGCLKHFCGWCLDPFPDSSSCHSHVKVCNMNIKHKGGYYGTKEDFCSVQASIRTQKILDYIETHVGEEDRDGLKEFMRNIDLVPLGIFL